MSSKWVCNSSEKGQHVVFACIQQQIDMHSLRRIPEAIMERSRMVHYDIVVVGAGPAGSIAAYKCAQQGLTTLLLEKFKLPREKPCGGAVMYRGLRLIREGVPKHLIERCIHGLRFGFPDGKFTEFVSEKLIGITVDRAPFDEFLAHRAADAGAELHDETRVTGVTVREDHVIVHRRDESDVTAKLVIGADGVKSIVARSVGLRPERKPPEEVGLGMESDIYVGEDGVEQVTNGHPDILEILPVRGRVSYGWVFPKSDHLAIGVAGAAPHMHPLRGIFDKFLKDLERRFKIPLTPSKRRTHFLDGTGVVKENVTDRVILAGDAAGFIDPMMGEGIAYAMKSGYYAAQIAHEAIEKKQFDKHHLGRYDEICRREFADNFNMAAWAASKGVNFAEFLLSRVNGHKLASDIMAMVARGEIGYSDIPTVVIRRLPRELPNIIRTLIIKRMMNSNS